MITKTLAMVIDGELPLEQVPEGMRQGVEHMLDFYCYQKACWVLEAQDIQIRRMRLETFQEHIRPAVEKWARKLFEGRKSIRR